MLALARPLADHLADLAPAALAALASALVLAAWASRIWLWWRYRPVPSPADADLPAVTVVIPAFNEGATVRRAIASVLASDYPRDRLRVVVVDDGSTDDTGRHVDAACALDPSRALAVHLPRNLGKRHALHEGFLRAEGDVAVTIDSDSIVSPGALRALVAPLVRDPRVAGVAGKVLAWNRRRNLLTRMLGVRYVLGFDFVRAYQSGLGTVWCCPGALQAYRLEVIRPHLRKWRDQTFLGVPCTNGDDHALTNLVLALGFRTAYQSTATVETLVPWTYRRLCKMYVRWGRSATREGLRALRFAPERAFALSGPAARDLPLGPLTGAFVLLDAVLHPLMIALRAAAFPATIALLVLHPLATALSLAHGAALATAFALLYCALFLRSERSPETLLGLLYAWFALLALPWVQPFATATVRRNGWLTRS